MPRAERHCVDRPRGFSQTRRRRIVETFHNNRAERCPPRLGGPTVMHAWLADRTAKFDSSGIRKVFDLAAKMADPINLSIGQPDFAVPEAIKDAAIAAIGGDKNGYS